MFKWLAKKYAVGVVNDLLKKLNGKYDVECYRVRIMKVLKFLNNLLEVLDDGEVTADEADKIVEETASLF